MGLRSRHPGKGRLPKSRISVKEIPLTGVVLLKEGAVVDRRLISPRYAPGYYPKGKKQPRKGVNISKPLSGKDIKTAFA